jgi:hypothetical protein
MRGTAMKPLARVGKNLIYRTHIVMASHVRYLNLAALKKARRAEIEIGSVTVGELTVPIVAEIKNGLITRLSPAHCQGCGPRRSKRARPQRQRKKLLRDVFAKVHALGVGGTTTLPISVAHLPTAQDLITIDVVVCPDGTVCIRVETEDGYGCLYCRDGTTCYRPSAPPVL